MKCPSCGRAGALSGFPGAVVRCACGADVVIPPAEPALAPADPYRDPPRRAPAPAPAPRSALRRCPRCAHGLARIPGERHACAHCHGELWDHASLTAELESAREDHRRGPSQPGGSAGAGSRPGPFEASVSYLRCPLCDDVMTRMNFGQRSGIIVDVCKEHGTWLDEGEHARVLAFVRAHGLEADLPPLRRGADAGDPAALGRRAEAMLHYEALRDEQAIASAIETAGDLVWLLFD